MADDLMIEVTGSVQKADTALDRIIKKIDDLRTHFDKAAPSVTKFAAQMDKIASSSKAFSAFQKLADGTDKQAIASKKAEAQIASYNASLTRSEAVKAKAAAATTKANAIAEQAAAISAKAKAATDAATLSNWKHEASLEKVVAATQKVTEAQRMEANNRTAFSMPPEDFMAKYNHTNNSGTNLTPDIYLEETGPTPTNAPTPEYDTQKIQAEMDALTANIEGKKPKVSLDVDAATAEVQRIGEYIDGLTPQISHMSAEAQAQFNALAAKLNLVSQQIDNQRMMYRSLAEQAAHVGAEQGEGSAAYLRLEKRMLSADSAAQRLAATQEKLQLQLADIASGAMTAGEQSEKAGSRSASGWSKTLGMFESMMIRIAAFRIFSAISQGVVTGINNMVLANSAANQTMSALSTNALYLKNSLAASLMPVLQSLVPVLNQVTDALANVFNTIGMLTARIFNHASTVTIAKRANVDYAATLDKTKASADAAKKSLMGFDELNILNEQKAKEGITSPGMPSYDSMFETVKIPDWVEKIGEVTDKIQNLIKTNIDTVTRLLRLAPLVVGAVLAFSGVNVPLGIALMAVGAIEMGKQAKEDWDFLTNKTNSSLDKTKKILQIVGAVELALGAVLAFSGAAVGLGIALMIGGITTTAATLKWDSMGEQVKKSMGAITFTSAIAMLALGSILTFSGANVALGVGLLIGGATTMWASATLNWNSMDIQTKQTISKIATATGGLLLTIGMILAFTGVGMALGIGLIAAGAITLGSAAALNGNSIQDIIKTVIADILAIGSDLLIAIGIILCLTGGGIPLGVGLIIAGLAGSAFAKSLSTDPITTWAQSLVDRIVGVFNRGIDAITNKYQEAGKGLGGLGFEGGGGGFGGGGGIRDATGTAFHPGGPAIVNDQLGSVYQELVRLPNGLSFIPSGRNVLIPDLPRGSSVLNATQTKQLFPKYAEGTGNRLAPTIRWQDEQPQSSAGLDTERIIDRMDRMEKAIREMKLYLYTDDRKIAESSNRGNKLIGRTAPTA